MAEASHQIDHGEHRDTSKIPRRSLTKHSASNVATCGLITATSDTLLRGRRDTIPVGGSDCDHHTFVHGPKSGWYKRVRPPVSKLLELPENTRTIGALWNAQLASRCRTGITAAPGAVGSQMARLCGERGNCRKEGYNFVIADHHPCGKPWLRH